jgi:hypothetical protein
MAEETQTQDQAAAEESNGGNGTNGGHKTAVRAAAIAAATGAAALAARKALSGKDQSEGNEKSASARSGGNQSTLVAMATSGLGAAKDSLLPFAEEAAGAAGEWVGRNGPDYVRDSIVPQFISGFERAQKSSEE